MPAVESLVAACADPLHVKPELMQSQVEIATSPWATPGQAHEELRTLRASLVRAAALQGVRPAAAGTHPLAIAETQRLTQRDRYREMAAEIRYPLRRELCFGLHVHVSVGSADKAVAVLEGLVPYLPLLLAVSASSPFWRAAESGLASTRTAVFQAMPRSGLPPHFMDYADYADQLERMRRAGAVADHSRLWWDARPHPRLGTVEVRIMDAQPLAEVTAALAGLVQALVRNLGRRYDRGEGFAPAPRAIVAENRWLAARHGLRAPLIDVAGDTSTPARSAIAELLDALSADDGRPMEAGWALDCIERVARVGTSADRQLGLARSGQSLQNVVRSLTHETGV